ncbi:homoserine kinase [Microbotryum lychnidis-dioicae p1A1 Lamole]|uniref:Homoserine kinase n=1 Tax=Microbotryum lychnidis-dioicae (strain p1A1 Lamole / MvSl-1064) TaxID=683840 RepID=U5HAR2_USTV1|nr:homoserine kinase [Microbotryum lychnidis-dioicae p1A1 Lamole]|eukprot:KDE05369.1 homoserine kinase [Microbotryum lychnidis-dioicae p1A1 Lamole]
MVFTAAPVAGERNWAIRVPASSANIGPGFDVLGLALSRHLTLNVNLTPSSAEESQVLLSYDGEGANEAPLDPYKNLITRVALYVLLSHHLTFPAAIVKVDIKNQVPFGRGLGSSASAVVAGVLLGDALGDLKLSQERVKDYALMVERHPDNVTAALVGGFTGSFLRTLDASELAPSSIPLAEVLPAYPANAGPPVPGQEEPPQPPVCVGRHVRYGFSKDIGVVVVVPKFEVETAKARGALPNTYPRADVVFNLQRLAVLTASLSQSPLDANVIWEAMRDRVHQPQREGLIPGLSKILNHMTPATHPGLLGICLSGAGPTILALVSNEKGADSNSDTILTDDSEITLGESTTSGGATPQMTRIGEAIKALWKEEGINVEWLALTVDDEGATLKES